MKFTAYKFLLSTLFTMMHCTLYMHAVKLKYTCACLCRSWQYMQEYIWPSCSEKHLQINRTYWWIKL